MPTRTPPDRSVVTGEPLSPFIVTRPGIAAVQRTILRCRRPPSASPITVLWYRTATGPRDVWIQKSRSTACTNSVSNSSSSCTTPVIRTSPSAATNSPASVTDMSCESRLIAGLSSSGPAIRRVSATLRRTSVRSTTSRPNCWGDSPRCVSDESTCRHDIAKIRSGKCERVNAQVTTPSARMPLSAVSTAICEGSAPSFSSNAFSGTRGSMSVGMAQSRRTPDTVA